MDDDSLADLHAPLIPILRHVLAQAPLPRAGVALDLACGPGRKAPLLAEFLGPGVRLIGVDSDSRAIRALTPDLRIEDRRLSGSHPLSSILDPRSSTPPSSVVGVVGDALALPLRDGCCDAAFCIAALGLFADQRAALCELRRVLRPGGLALLVVGAQMWAQAVAWPADLAARLGMAYAQALAGGAAPLPATPDLGGELADLLAGAGFAASLVRAFRLDPHQPASPWSVTSSQWQPTADRRPPAIDHRPPTADRRRRATDKPQGPNPQPPTPNPQLTELPLLPWSALRALLAGRLAAADLARCDQAAAADIELCALALVALARAP